MKEDTPQWIIICMMKALSLLGVIMIILMMIAIMTAPLHCQCVDTQYVAPSGKVVRVTNNCVPPDDCQHYLYPSGIVLDSMYTAADALYWAERCQAKLITITLTKGCPTCGSMDRVQYPDETARLEWFDEHNRVSRLSEVSVCKRCGTVYRGRR